MDGIELMVEEHKNIKKALAVIRKLCFRLLTEDDVDYEDFYKIIDFVRNYADKHHHGKEETILFEMMMDELGTVAEKLVKFGMNIEHDLGRLHMQELEAAVQRVQNGDDESKLDIIANAISYTHLLHRHIDKEDNVAYVYARNNLQRATLERLNAECEKFEREADRRQTTQKYLTLINDIEKKIETTGS